ncbi:hypothetical protein [Brevundimonas sp.]|jgi:hypothetical protein|uniref:hypothetical protein n=1 Tax=Brevundimonas sp. TaxID=1871086 RepID=UPI002ED959B9
MRIAALVAAGLLAAVSTPAFAQDRAPTPVPVEEWSTDKVAEIGKAIYRHDVAAWVATDALLAHLNGRAPVQGLAGWIVVEQGPDLLVRFVRTEGEATLPAYDIPVRDGVAGAVTEVASGELSPGELARLRARNTAAANIGRLRCSAQLNNVVLPDPDGDGWLVWLLTSTTDANIVPFGGHYRFRISADGSTVVRRDMLSNSCINLPRQQEGATGRPAGLMISQIVSNGPVETHVFLSLQNRLPIYVMAGNQLFEVNGPEIRKVER